MMMNNDSDDNVDKDDDGDGNYDIPTSAISGGANDFTLGCGALLLLAYNDDDDDDGILLEIL